MNKILNTILNPFIISIPIVLLIILILPSIFYKFEIIEVKHNRINDNERQFYHDLNHDGFDEYLQLAYGKGFGNLPFLSCNTDFSIDSGYRHLQEINFSKQWLEKTEVKFGDFDQNELDEMFVFARSADSLFLLVFKPLEKVIFREKFIAKCVFYKNIPDFAICTSGLFDLNGDNKKEYIFSITAGLSLTPRSIYAYDIFNDSIYVKDVKFANIELDKKSIVQHSKLGTIIVPNSFASQNYSDTISITYNDLYAWLMPLNESLDFIFSPIPNVSEKTGITAYPIQEGDEFFIYAYFRNYIPDGKNELRKYTLSGQLIAQKEYGFSKNSMLVKTGYGKDSKLFLTNILEESVFLIHPDLSLTKKNNSNPFTALVFEIDLDVDQQDEVIIFDLINNELWVYRNDLTNQCNIDFAFYGNHIFNVSRCMFKDNSANLFVQVGNNAIFYKYAKNNFYYLKYPLYATIYLVISLFLFALLKFQKRNLQNKFELEKRMTELELLTIKNQIDPHFTFNAINTLSSVFYNEDKKTAHEFLVDFSSLIRNTLNHSKKIAIPLKDEIDFVQNYLKLQQFRYSNKFDFSIQVDKEINQETTVPRMIIQTFAENAVKHGLINKEGKGNLIISVQPIKVNHPMNHPTRIQIEITDDGIGREKSKQVLNYKQISTGNGHEIIKQIVEMYNRLNKTEVSFKILDLKDSENTISGTKVTIVV